MAVLQRLRVGRCLRARPRVGYGVVAEAQPGADIRAACPHLLVPGSNKCSALLSSRD